MAERAVRCGHHPGLAHQCFDIVLRHVEGRDLCPPPTFRRDLCDDADRSLDRIDPLGLRLFFQGPPCPDPTGSGEKQRRGSTPAAQIFVHFRADTRLGRRIGEPRQQRFRPAIDRPARQQRGIETRSRSQPGILVGGHIDPPRPRRLDQGDQGRRFALHVHTQRLDMRDMDRRARLLADADRFPRRIQQSDRIGGFIALMRIVKPAALPCYPRQSDHLPGRGEALRGIEQARRKARRARAHRACDQLLHGVELVAIGRARHIAQHPPPNRAEAHEGNHIGADARIGQLARILRDIGRAAAIDADHHRARPLGQPGGVEPLGGIVRAQEDIRMGVRIDEARRHDLAPRVDHPSGRKLARRSDIGDPVARDRNVSRIGWRLAAVIDGSAADHDIDGRRRAGGAGSQRQSAGECGKGWQAEDRQGRHDERSSSRPTTQIAPRGNRRKAFTIAADPSTPEPCRHI